MLNNLISYMSEDGVMVSVLWVAIRKDQNYFPYPELLALIQFRAGEESYYFSEDT